MRLSTSISYPLHPVFVAASRSSSRVTPKPGASLSCSQPSRWRSEEHTSELQSLMRISYSVFCFKIHISFSFFLLFFFFSFFFFFLFFSFLFFFFLFSLFSSFFF